MGTHISLHCVCVALGFWLQGALSVVLSAFWNIPTLLQGGCLPPIFTQSLELPWTAETTDT